MAVGLLLGLGRSMAVLIDLIFKRPILTARMSPSCSCTRTPIRSGLKLAHILNGATLGFLSTVKTLSIGRRRFQPTLP